MEYNGYTNWATHNVMLWASNTESDYNAMRAFVKATPTLNSDNVKEFFTNLYPNGTPDMQGSEKGSMADVDWASLIPHLEEEREKGDVSSRHTFDHVTKLLTNLSELAPDSDLINKAKAELENAKAELDKKPTQQPVDEARMYNDIYEEIKAYEWDHEVTISRPYVDVYADGNVIKVDEASGDVEMSMPSGEADSLANNIAHVIMKHLNQTT